jgi:hypothetical protein
MKAMDFIKKKLFLILCIAVVVLGIGIFVSGMMVSKNNQKELAAITTTIDSVRGLRPIPQAEVAQAESDAEGYQQNLAITETRMEETTRRPVLYREVFPKLNNEADKYTHFEYFAKKYTGFVGELLASLHAGSCPTEQEELQQIERFKTALESSSASRIDRDQIEKICKELRQKRAQEYAIYADPSCFCVYMHWKRLPGSSKPMYTDAWYTQLAAWIQEDVVTAIASLNGSSERILDSPVKRLLEISFSGDEPEGEPTLEETKVATRSSHTGSTSYGGRQRRSVSVGRRSVGSEMKLPKYVRQQGKQTTGSIRALGMSRSGSSSTQYEGHIAVPFTEHHSDDIIDAVHFEVGIIIDSSQIHDFIHHLESQKKSRVLRIKTLPKDKSYVLDRARIQEVLRELQSSSGTSVLIHGLQINKSDIEVKEIHRNQITVLQMDIEPLDLAAEEDAGYYYGNGAFKVLRLTCEYFFFKNGYVDLQPEPIQEILNPKGKSTPTGNFNFNVR